MLIETEMKCSNISWTAPVRVRVSHGSVVEVDGPQAALNVMMQRWPETRGERYAAARNLCMAAMGRRVPAAAIRDDFVAACADAGILAE